MIIFATIYFLGLLLTIFAFRAPLNFVTIFQLLILLPTLGAQHSVTAVMTFGVFSLSLGAFFSYVFLYRSRLDGYVSKAKEGAFISGVGSEGMLVLGAGVASIICILASIYYYRNVGISLFADEVGFARLANRHNVSGSFFFQRLFRVVLPIILLLLISYFMISGFNKKKILIISILSFVTITLLMFTGIRGNVVTFWFFPIIVFISLYTTKATFKNAFAAFLLVFSLILVSTYYMYQFDGGLLYTNVVFLSEILFHRLTVGATDGIEYSIMRDVPTHGYYYGSLYIQDILSLFSKLGIIDQYVQNYSAEMAQAMLGERYLGENAAVFVFGEFYANFGWSGLVICSICLGFGLHVYYVKTLKTKKTPIRVSIHSFFSAALISILGGPSLSMLVDYAAVCVFCYISFRLFVSLRHLRRVEWRILHV